MLEFDENFLIPLVDNGAFNNFKTVLNNFLVRKFFEIVFKKMLLLGNVISLPGKQNIHILKKTRRKNIK